jgi:hypothetical protein
MGYIAAYMTRNFRGERHSLIIPLIQALYDPQCPMPTELEFYELALEDTEFFAIGSQVYALLKHDDQLRLTPPFFQNRLKYHYDQTLFLNMLIHNQTESIFRKFEELGIAVIPLKGVYFAKRYFGHIGARGTSDIDLLVKRSDMAQATEGVRSLGFIVEEERIHSHFHWSFSKPLPHSPIPLTVELHWDLLVEGTSDLNIDEFWNQATRIEPYQFIMALSDYHSFYMICLHGWRHNLNSMKYFIDIIQLIHVLRDKLDYAVLLKDAASHRTLRRITRMLAIVYQHFPHLDRVKELPLPKRSRLWWSYNSIRYHDDRTIGQYFNMIYYYFMDFDTIKQSLMGPYRFLKLGNRKWLTGGK